jgi:hypothetical protein
MTRKIITLSIPQEEFEKIEEARKKELRGISSFFCIAGVKRAEEILERK